MGDSQWSKSTKQSISFLRATFVSVFSPFATSIQPAIMEEGIVPAAKAPVDCEEREAPVDPVDREAGVERVITAAVDPRKVKVAGVGILPEGIPASFPVSFKVFTHEAGQSDLDVVITVR